MTEPLPSVLLIGGPDAGKSNFLFRFWMAVDDGKGVLIKAQLPDEVEYLRTGSESLQGGKFAGRTSKEVLEHVSIPVKSAGAPERDGILNVPDVPGEKILEVYRKRQWPQMWEEKITASCGCLVFVRAASDEVVTSLDYVQCVALFGQPLPKAAAETDLKPPASAGPMEKDSAAKNEGAAESHPKPDAQPPEATKPAEKESAAKNLEQQNYDPPTDVVLTDWLQFLRTAFTERVGGSFMPRIGIVVAAWDAVPTDSQERMPQEYLAENFPLTAQFIQANDDRFEFQLFGASVLSGDPTKDDDFKREFEHGKPTNFGYIIHSLYGKREKFSDMTVPVAWALGWLSSEKA